jgi:catechol 2,3-dioxygenase-like lactoylglutathione lyase family enzyme
MAADLEPALVPESLVTNLDTSLGFWTQLCGFTVRYSRPDDGFAYLTSGAAHVMLDQVGVGRDWITAPLDPPLGRGINLQIAVPDAVMIATTLVCAEVTLFMQPEAKWYRINDEEVGILQILVTDPDGYLLRFASSVGRRTAVP